MLLTVIIPVFNEVKTIDEVLKRVNELDLKKEIIVVDDFSTDGTREKLTCYQYNAGIKCFFHKTNMGKGSAIRTGLQHAMGDLVIIQDADLEYDPEDFYKLIKPFKNGEADVVYGSRFKGNFKGMRLQNIIANKLLTVLTNILYGAHITDMETCYKMMRTDLVKNIHLRANRFDFEPEITAKILRKKIRFLEVPITYNGRTHSQGKKIGWKDGFHAIFALIKYRFLN